MIAILNRINNRIQVTHKVCPTIDPFVMFVGLILLNQFVKNIAIYKP